MRRRWPPVRRELAELSTNLAELMGHFVVEQAGRQTAQVAAPTAKREVTPLSGGRPAKTRGPRVA